MEDFVPFSLAKKLKEKGFREECLAYYTSEYTLYNNTICLTEDKYLCLSEIDYNEFLKSNNEETKLENICDAPTISQVLKWLREEKKIFIDIRTSIDLNGKEHFSYYIIYNKVSIREGYTDFDWKFEQAALAGIEYVIDNNLI